MSSLISRIKKLKSELQQYPIGNCSPSDDPDKQTAYIYAFREVVKRFILSAKRLDNQELLDLISKLDPEPESIIEAYDLKAEMTGVFDLIDDIINEPNNKLQSAPFIDPVTSNELTNVICDSLATESANHLHTICSNYGLATGTREESFSGKYNYVYSRISHFNPKELWKLAKQIQGKYPNNSLDEIIYSLENSDHLSIEAKFENIKQRIIKEIHQSQFLIWVAVAWFTDRDIANELYKKSKQGVNIQIIVIDDKINFKLCSKFDAHFENYKLPSSHKFKSIMHHKFCIIDLKKVIHGSYNWTTKAQYNNETITISEGRYIAEKFAKEFIKIKSAASV